MGSSFSMPFLQLLVTQNIQARIFFQLQLPAVQQLQISSKHLFVVQGNRLMLLTRVHELKPTMYHNTPLFVCEHVTYIKTSGVTYYTLCSQTDSLT